MKTHLILREKALKNFGDKETFNKAVQKIEEEFCMLSMQPIDFYIKLYNLSLTNKKVIREDKTIFENIKFPEPKEIDWSKYIEPKKEVLVTINGGITITNLESLE